MFLGGLLMAVVPVSVGVAFFVFFYKEFKKDRLLAESSPPSKTP